MSTKADTGTAFNVVHLINPAPHQKPHRDDRNQNTVTLTIANQTIPRLIR